MSSVLMIIIVLLISNDPTYWSLVFNVCCACATATFSYPDNLLICDWVVSSGVNPAGDGGTRPPKCRMGDGNASCSPKYGGDFVA